MKLGVYALTLISLATSLAAAQPAPQPAPPPAGEPAPYPAPPPQPQTYPAPTYPQPQPYPQQYAPPPAPYAVPYAAPMPEPTLDGPKHTGTGVMLSLGATFLPPLLLGAALDNDSNGSDDDDAVIGILLTSALLGPSAGHMYAGDFFTVGLGVRAASLAVILIGINSDADTDDEIGYIVLGTLGLIGGGIADVASIGGAVRDYNFEHAKKTLSPMIAPGRGADGTTHLRIGLTGSF